MPIAVRVLSSIRSVKAIMFISSYEFVTYSVHSQKVTRFLGNGFEFLANANNMGIHGAGGREILVAPDLVEKALAAKRLSGVTEKVLEQLKLLPDFWLSSLEHKENRMWGTTSILEIKAWTASTSPDSKLRSLTIANSIGARAGHNRPAIRAG